MADLTKFQQVLIDSINTKQHVFELEKGIGKGPIKESNYFCWRKKVRRRNSDTFVRLPRKKKAFLKKKIIRMNSTVAVGYTYTLVRGKITPNVLIANPPDKFIGFKSDSYND